MLLKSPKIKFPCDVFIIFQIIKLLIFILFSYRLITLTLFNFKKLITRISNFVITVSRK